MTMTNWPLRALASLATCAILLIAGCSDDEGVGQSCLLTPSIAFDGREYTEAQRERGSTEEQVRVGRHLGVGEAAACGGADGERVEVFKVVGIPVGEAVYSKPVWGLMERTHFDEE